MLHFFSNLYQEAFDIPVSPLICIRTHKLPKVLKFSFDLSNIHKTHLSTLLLSWALSEKILMGSVIKLLDLVIQNPIIIKFRNRIQ